MRAGVVTVMVAVLLLALPGAAGAQGLDTTCQFSLTRLDASTTNVLAVDTNAVYWGGTYAGLPGTRIRIEGQFPHARYMSWNLYDSAARPIDALSDAQLRLDRTAATPRSSSSGRGPSNPRRTRSTAGTHAAGPSCTASTCPTRARTPRAACRFRR